MSNRPTSDDHKNNEALNGNQKVSHCLFCHMNTIFRLFKVPLCHICRDQVYDFTWVSMVQTIVFSLGLINGYTFVMEEILLFVVLVIVKHRVPAPWDR